MLLLKFLPILEDYPGPGSTPDKWQWREIEGGFTPERLHKYGTTMLEGHEFHVCQRTVFMVYHGVRWWSFLSEQTVRDKLRCVCRHTAAVFGSKQIIYLPVASLNLKAL